MSDDKCWVHEKGLCDSDAIGPGTRIWAFAHVMKDVTIGADCNVGESVFVESGASVGDRVTIKNGVQIWEGITIEDDVFVGPGVVFTNDPFPRSPRAEAVAERYEGKGWLRPVTVRRGASIGANATILPGVVVGEYAVVGAGAVVTREVLPHAVVMGCPAQQRGFACVCGHVLPEEDDPSVCGACGRSYTIQGHTVETMNAE